MGLRYIKILTQTEQLVYKFFVETQAQFSLQLKVSNRTSYLFLLLNFDLLIMSRTSTYLSG